MHIPYDLDGYHYSLADYAFLSLKQFRFPQWDPSTYSGMSFAANVQSAFYYPGTWIMFLMTWARQRLSYQALQDLDLAHVALAFTLCYLWLSRKRLVPMAALLGAVIYAYSGYMCLQLQHLGLIVAYAWFPLAFLGIDEVAERKSWLPLWKVVAASALAFLGGYPPTWVVFAIAATTYAFASPGRLRTVPATLVAFAFSLAVCAIQGLPTWDATHFRGPEARYGTGYDDPIYFISYLVPNYFDFGLNMSPLTNFGKEYLYLGAPGILGIALAFTRDKFVKIVPALAVTAISLIFFANPFNIVLNAIQNSLLLLDILRSTYFLAGVSVGLAELSAQGLDAFLTRKSEPVPRWMLWVALTLMGSWATYELVRWFQPYASANFAHGMAGIFDPAITLVIFALAIYVYRAQSGFWRSVMAAILVIFSAIDYKAFGTSKRFNAGQGDGPVYSWNSFGAMNVEAERALRPPSDYRVLLFDQGPPPHAARHVGWNTAQGFEPFVSIVYHKLGATLGTWPTDRGLSIDPTNLEALELLGVRFVIVGEGASAYHPLLEHPRFRGIDITHGAYKVFEYLDSKPIYQLHGSSEDRIDVLRREPEHRILKVSSKQEGLLSFAEQSYPGWSAKLDGSPLAIEPWQIAFQAVRVPPGEHTVEFIYSERLLPLGATISLISLALLAGWIIADRKASSKSIYSRANPAVSG